MLYWVGQSWYDSFYWNVIIKWKHLKFNQFIKWPTIYRDTFFLLSICYWLNYISDICRSFTTWFFFFSSSMLLNIIVTLPVACWFIILVHATQTRCFEEKSKILYKYKYAPFTWKLKHKFQSLMSNTFCVMPKDLPESYFYLHICHLFSGKFTKEEVSVDEKKYV